MLPFVNEVAALTLQKKGATLAFIKYFLKIYEVIKALQTDHLQIIYFEVQTRFLRLPVILILLPPESYNFSSSSFTIC